MAHYPVHETALLFGVTRDTFTKYEGALPCRTT